MNMIIIFFDSLSVNRVLLQLEHEVTLSFLERPSVKMTSHRRPLTVPESLP